MRWYSPFDWIPGPETEEEMEELRRLRKKTDKQSEESSAAVVTGMEIADHLSSLLAERVFVGSNFPVLGSRYMPLAFITCNLCVWHPLHFFRAWKDYMFSRASSSSRLSQRLASLACIPAPALPTRRLISRALNS